MSDAATTLETGIRLKAQDILEAARDLFIAKGFEAASMDGVARAAGVSKATVYAHFKSKNELFAAIVAQVSGQLTAEIRAVIDAKLPLRQALMRIGSKFLEVLTDPRRVRMFRMMVAEVDRFPELGRVFYEAGPLVMQDCLSRFLEGAAKAGRLDIPDPGLATRQFLSLIKADLHLRCLLVLGTDPSPEDRARQVAAAVDMFLKAYGTAQA
jgi:TetR/AcrR family transcriptional regulator, mexJK operon transcriptional repressor